ncbi:MAG TPA: glycosyltransferase [Pyrinomonadaceae bacterium]|nr:glycosyltransferase [Pyrinomonadaceae bacterium]
MSSLQSQLKSDVSSSEPLVSVIIPAFKVASFIEQTVSSVLAQTFTNYEVIVINDGSPDTELLEKNLSRFSGVISYIKQPNAGAGAARNAGLKIARGEFVAFLDGDDVWLPEFLDAQLELINSGAGYDLVYTDAINFDERGRSRLTNMDLNPSDGPVTAESLIAGTCNIITSSVVARRELIEAVGYFDESFPNSQDYDLWLRLAKRGARITYQKRVLVERRIYEGSLASDPIKSFSGEISVLEKTATRSDLTAAEREALKRKLELRHASIAVCRGKQQLSSGDFGAAAAAFRAANAFYQSWKLRAVLFSLYFAPRLLQRVYKLRTT